MRLDAALFSMTMLGKLNNESMEVVKLKISFRTLGNFCQHQQRFGIMTTHMQYHAISCNYMPQQIYGQLFEVLWVLVVSGTKRNMFSIVGAVSLKAVCLRCTWFGTKKCGKVWHGLLMGFLIKIDNSPKAWAKREQALAAHSWWQHFEIKVFHL